MVSVRDDEQVEIPRPGALGAQLPATVGQAARVFDAVLELDVLGQLEGVVL